MIRRYFCLIQPTVDLEHLRIELKYNSERVLLLKVIKYWLIHIQKNNQYLTLYQKIHKRSFEIEKYKKVSQY